MKAYNTMKIVFSIKSANSPGGTERVTSVLSKSLAERGHEVHVVSFVGGGEASFFEYDKRVSMHYLSDGRDGHIFPFRDLRRIRLLKKLYKSVNPDIVLIVDAGRSFVNIPAAKGYTTITWEHFNIGVKWHLMHGLSRKMAAKRSDCIVTLTRSDEAGYVNKFHAKKALCIPNPVTIDCKRGDVARKNIVLVMGRIVKQKGQDMLVQAWKQVAAEHPGWKLKIVGEGKMQGQVEDYVRRNGLEKSVEFLSPAKEVVSLYSEAAFFVMSSRFEGLPLTLIEATCMGLPIVSFDCPTGPAHIVKDGETGILVPPEDVDGLAAAMARMMENADLRKRFSENALKQAARYNVDSITDRWENLFRELKQ